MMVKYMFLFFVLVSSQVHAALAAELTLNPSKSPSELPIPLREVQCLAKAIYFEATHNNTMMQEAVAGVIINRVEDDRYPDTICDVIHQRAKRVCQFSWYCSAEKSMSPDGWASALMVAQRVVRSWLSKESYDITHGATHFHDTRVHPSWSARLQRTLTVSNMLFYK